MAQVKKIKQNHQQLELFQPDYLVTITDWNGKRTVPCDTVRQAWDAIGTKSFGGGHQVSSPTGKSVYEFVPY